MLIMHIDRLHFFDLDFDRDLNFFLGSFKDSSL